MHEKGCTTDGDAMQKKSEILEMLLRATGSKHPIPLGEGWRLEYYPEGWLVMAGDYTVLGNSDNGIFFKTAYKAYKAWRGHRKTFRV
jgi:hypothetical protein